MAAIVGAFDGRAVGVLLGDADGDSVVATVGVAEGTIDGFDEGARVGTPVGPLDGALDGLSEDCCWVGCDDGAWLGTTTREVVGAVDVAMDGFDEGDILGSTGAGVVAMGAREGALEGATDGASGLQIRNENEGLRYKRSLERYRPRNTILTRRLAGDRSKNPFDESLSHYSLAQVHSLDDST